MEEVEPYGVTTAPDVTVPPRRYTDAAFEAGDLDALERFGRELLARDLDDPAALEAWILDWSELASLVYAGRTRRWIAVSRNTSDDEIREAFRDFSDRILPAWQRIRAQLARRYLDCEHRTVLPERFTMFQRAMVREDELFRDANVERKALDRAIRTRHSQIVGDRTVALDGESLTVQQARQQLSEPARATRKKAFVAIEASVTADAEAMHELLDEAIEIRHAMALEADYDRYTEYAFRERGRDDYTPADCLSFHDAVERIVVPAQRDRQARRRELLGLGVLRPWDRAVDPRRERPHRPFRDQAGYVDIGRRLFQAVDPRFAEEFEVLVRNDLLDLMSRPGKAPGGYNAEVHDIRLPFIFSNAVGDAREVRTLLHEGGHAFHTLATRGEPVPELSHSPIEFAEVASMAMELFAMEEFGTVYEERDARLNAIAMLEGRLASLAWIAAIDAFQHWLYAQPDHSHAERDAAWLAIHERFSTDIDWSGFELERSRAWQQQQHIYRVPFYYIEYAIASMGALQLWRRYRDDKKTAIEDYRAALALGGSRPLPELFERAGARFGLDEPLLREVVDDMVGVINRLDDSA